MSTSARRAPKDLGVDFVEGHRLIEVKTGVAGLRVVRMGLMQLAHAMSERPRAEGFLVLPDVTVTRQRLEQEWQRATEVLKPELAARLSVCILEQGRFAGIPRDPDPATQRVLSRVVTSERTQSARRPARGDAAFVVQKILLLHWLTDGRPITSEWLAKASGFSYPTIASALRGLGSLIERGSDRRIRLRWFSREEFARLSAVSDRARATARFADRSARARSVDAHLKRLQKLDPPDLAIGGVVGARHHFRGLDITAAPRLDLSLHSPKRHLDLGFIEQLDPALQRVNDPLERATVVVHAVRHADPFFQPRKGGLQWADPVECLLDLHEARLDAEATRFLAELQRNRPKTS